MSAGPDWKTLGDEAVEITRSYLRIDTTNPPGNETPAAEFLAGILGEAGLETTLLESAPGRGNLIARLPGRANDPGGALCLLHHLDVVPADPSEWSVDPFGAEMRDGYLWGRGAIDMKSMGVTRRRRSNGRSSLSPWPTRRRAGGWAPVGSPNTTPPSSPAGTSSTRAATGSPTPSRR